MDRNIIGNSYVNFVVYYINNGNKIISLSTLPFTYYNQSFQMFHNDA
jgi:hypothetical protein